VHTIDTAQLRAPTPEVGGWQMPGRDARSDATIAGIGSTNPIRLLLVDDKLIVREGLRAFLEREAGFSVVAQASSLAEAVALDVACDVVVTDLVLPDARGRDVVIALRSRFARSAIFALTDIDRREHVTQMVSAGVGGYVLKTATADEFLSGIRTAAQGLQYVQAALRSEMARPHQTAAAGSNSELSTVSALTAKEREVLRLLVLGHTNAEIAGSCGVSLRTVEARRARVLQKLGVRTRAELVRAAGRVSDLEL
jgi:two-component system, NarL family, response regulator NreC